MKCFLKSFCKKKFLCCHFCLNKKCWQRCTDKTTKCKWFGKEKVDVSDIDAVNTPPTGYIKTKPVKKKLKKISRKGEQSEKPVLES